MSMNPEIAKLLSRILDPEDLGLAATPGLRDIARFALGMPIVESDLVAFFGQACEPIDRQPKETLILTREKWLREFNALLEDYVGACVELTLYRSTRRNMAVRMPYSRQIKLFEYVVEMISAKQSQENPVPAQAYTDQWYLQDTRSYVGNDVLFWAKDGKGYTTDVSKAHVYSGEEAIRKTAIRGTDRAWPKSYIDSKTRPAVDMQYINHAEAIAQQSQPQQVNK